MADEELRTRLAELIVEALGVGTGKHEFDVINEIFDSFGVTFRNIDEQFASNLPGRAQQLRRRAAKQLSAAAPAAEALLNEVVRVGGRFIAMLSEVYVRLSRHVAAVGGAGAETFRFQRGGIDEDQLTISPAFIEQIRQLQQSVRMIDTGRINERDIYSFLGWDNGFYGHWPTTGANGEQQRLAAWVLAMRRVRTIAQDPEDSPAERLVAAAERLVRARLARLEMLLETGTDPHTATDPDADERPNGQRVGGTLAADLERFRETGLIGIAVYPGTVPGVGSRRSVIGLRADLTPGVVPLDDDRFRPDTPVGELAGFAAMWRLGLQPSSGQLDRERDLPADRAARDVWLRGYRTACDQAAQWMMNEVFTADGIYQATRVIEVVREFLNLPLWRQRDLLYEIWVLCATLDACEQAGWTVELNGLTRSNGVWVLPVGRAGTPVASLRNDADPAVSLDVWREPSRSTGLQELTPDVTVATPHPYTRDLLVVEAKDRRKMSPGRRRDRAGPGQPGERTALGVADRYATGLRPRVVWVCNHCDFREGVSAETNHGDLWTRIHVADRFRPGNVPEVFAESVRAALAPPLRAAESPRDAPADDTRSSPRPGLVLVIDVTSSMRSRIDGALAVLASSSATASHDEFRAVVYSDHGTSEPVLVRKVGPFGNLPDLLNALKPLPAGHGGDPDEALEDAMQRCRELTEDIGPQDLLVLTDAAPHPVDKCPYKIDFEAEVRIMLAAGCHIQVADDWYNGKTWDAFQGIPGFQSAPLNTLITEPVGH